MTDTSTLIASLTAELTERDASIAQNESLRSLLADANSNRDAALSQAQALQAQLESANQTIAGYSTSCNDALNVQREQSEQVRVAMQVELDRLRTQPDPRVAELQGEIAIANDTIASLRETIARLNERIDQAQAEA